jgi:class 3 adenylate cyclase/TolB-like protein/Flp pilus assembly protein TadD
MKNGYLRTPPPAAPFTPAAFARRLTAIVFADVVGYSRLMGGDETHTLDELRRQRSAFQEAATACGGRIVNTAGDSILAEFASVVAAVKCSLRFQRQSSGAEASPDGHPPLQFRMGVHVGDVLIEGDQIYGDAVNVAARLQALAEAGGLCISRSVRDQIRDHLPVRFRDAGEQQVKNIARPVRVFALSREDLNDLSPEVVAELSSPTPLLLHASAKGKPRVAVLPFTSGTANPDYAYFGYGLTEDIIRLLGRARWLDVLTRHSTQLFHGGPASAREIGAALGARYLVEGTFSKRGDQVRITAELIEAETERQLWSEVYAFELADIFDVQEEMARQIAATIEPELSSVEQEIAARKPPGSLDAWDLYQRGFWNLWAFTQAGFETAERLFREAIELDPGLARAHAALSYVKLQECFYADPPDRPALLSAAFRAAETAVRLDERDSVCHCVLGRALCLMRRPDEAIAALTKTIELNPSFAQGHFALAFTLVWCRREDEAIALLERAADLSPRDPHLWTFHHARSMAHFALGEMEQAELFSRRAIRQPNATYFPYTALVAILGLTGREEECPSAIGQLLAKKPGYSLSLARADFDYCVNEGLRESFLLGLRRAGIPDESASAA